MPHPLSIVVVSRLASLITFFRVDERTVADENPEFDPLGVGKFNLCVLDRDISLKSGHDDETCIEATTYVPLIL
jgi:hypothetical protein